jgi:hypothetical protein
MISTTILSVQISLFAFVGCGEKRLTLSHRATILLSAAEVLAREKTK